MATVPSRPEATRQTLVATDEVEDDLDRLFAEIESEEPGARLVVEEIAAGTKAATELRRMRLATGLTQRQLADTAGIKQGQLSRYERIDYRGHKLETLARIAQSVGWHWRFQLEPTAPAYSVVGTFDGTLRVAHVAIETQVAAQPRKATITAIEATGAFSFIATEGEFHARKAG